MLPRYLRYAAAPLLPLALAAALTLALTACTQNGNDGASDGGSPNASPGAAPSNAGPPRDGSSRLARVRARGSLICAGNNANPGFGFLRDGNNVGFDVDLCRAVAAAVLGNPNAIQFRPVSAPEMGATIQAGEVDIMARTITVTSTREAQWGNFAQTMFYDGQGFMVRKDEGLTSVMQLAGAKVCVTQGTTTELNLQDFSNKNDLAIQAETFEKFDIAAEAYRSRQCDAFTTDHSGLYAYRSGFDDRDDHIILPEAISEEPLAPIVPHGDEQWYDIVKAVMAILIYAEAHGITSQNVPTAATGDPAVDRIFGIRGSFGQADLGLKNTVAQDVIRAVGNYGEIYARYLAPLGMPRAGGRNALWSAAPCTDCPKGGQLYASPFR